MIEFDLLGTAAEDGRAMLAAAESDWTRSVPHCPEWNAADLVGHLGGIFSWMAQIVTTGQRVSRRDREVPPADLQEMSRWYLGRMERTLEILGTTAPDTPVWTFSSRGVETVGWWRRRVAVETAIHRWDLEFAVSLDAPSVQALDNRVATAGIEEFLDEFLPGLLSQPEIVGLSGKLELETDDGSRRWDADLDAMRSPSGETNPDAAGVTVRGTDSDLLLWLTNREPSAPLFGRDAAGLGTAWRQLQR